MKDYSHKILSNPWLIQKVKKFSIKTNKSVFPFTKDNQNKRNKHQTQIVLSSPKSIKLPFTKKCPIIKPLFDSYYHSFLRIFYKL